MPLKEIIKQLMRQDMHWQTLITNAPDFILIVDLDLNINFINRVQVGFTQQDVLGKNLLSFVPEQQHDVVRSSLTQVAETEEVVFFQVIGHGSDFGERWYSSRAGPIKHQGKVVGFMMISSDTTELKNIEQQVMQQREALARINRVSLAGTIASGLAHQLNQPLSAIVNYAHGCQHRLEHNTIDKHHLAVTLRTISEYAEYASSMVANIRQFISKGITEKVKANINELVNDVYRIMNLEGRDINVVIHYLDGDVFIYANQVLIEQVLVNIITNALEALANLSHKNKQITIQLQQTPQQLIEIYVKNNGEAIAEHQVERLFVPFQTTKAEGIGLGLSMCRDILFDHDGSIDYLKELSEQLHETIFKVTIPQAY